MDTNNYLPNEKYTVNIDFDESQREWRKNKKSIGQGSFIYICGTITKKGEPCNNKPTYNGKCYLHK